jgi:hypothetical protein
MSANARAQAARAIPGILLAVLTVLGTHAAQAATVAHWRFEAGPAGANVPHTTASGVFQGTVPDESGNGNHLSVWSQGGASGYAFRADVPRPSLAQTGETNRFSVKNTGSYPALFTGGSPTGLNARTITPARFTVEASYKPEATGGYRTVVGRDARTVSSSDGNLAALYLQVRPDDSVGVKFTDVSGFTHSAFSPPGHLYGFALASNPEGTNAPWYDLAATSDGSTLKIYVNNLLVASTDLTQSGSPNRALAAGAASGADWVAGAWSVGRGLYAGGHTDRAFGFIDEVRISDEALAPGDFLAMSRPRISGLRVSGGSLAFDVGAGFPGTSCQVLTSTVAGIPLADWTPTVTRTFDANGRFTFLAAFDVASPQTFYALKAALPTTSPGALTYSLVGGNENWPADIRARIVYAMDGAVATYNRYGTFRKHLTVEYNTGVPTADANYSGRIRFGGQIGYRTALHEIGHTMGVGTISAWNANLSGGVWTGANGIAQIRAFDGATATANSDGTHFWPYGLNFDSEGGTENFRRHVLMVAAFRKDMGVE